MRVSAFAAVLLAAGFGAGCANNATSSGAVDLGGDDWRPSWKDDAGCNLYEHYDGVKCVLNNKVVFDDEKTCWDFGQVNALGVGRPCKPGVRECTDLKANCCNVDDQHQGAFCTMDCDTDADCGPATWCAFFHICMPAICKAGFTDPKKPTFYTAMNGFACDVTSVPASGLGRKCTLGGKECIGQKADQCLGDPANLDAMHTSFCSYDCAFDGDCGADAVCVYANGRPFFCSPRACAAQFDSIQFAHGPEQTDAPMCMRPGT